MNAANAGSAPPWPFEEALRTQAPVIVDDLPARFGPDLPTGAWSIAPRQAAVLPIARCRRDGPRRRAGRGAEPVPSVRRQLSRVPQSRGRPDRRGDRLRACLRGRTAARGGARRNRPREDRVLLQRQPRVPHAAHADARPARRTAREAGTRAPKTTANSIEVTHRNGLRLLKLVNALLDFSRIEAGRMQIQKQPTDIGAFTAELASLFRSAIEAAGMQLVIEWRA